ncbi:unnamed protein product [Rhizophagus irregularis]|uniref:Uncharacterized protein n=1 Tax=Rhizophagus irregularis TaxID=588596 RepID=A0A915ZGJ4_9GLOM|nr:unnamed protein product [Rhizophagus irregularis]CAB5373789.1 unnamed protein product [Rhizophagus irregularis]
MSLREHFPGTGFRLEDFSFLDYLGYWILSSRVLYFSFLDYLGYWISASWIIWDIGVWGEFTLNKHNNFILVQINK